MNKLQGNIAEIQVSGSLSLVKVKLGDLFLTSIIIDTPQTVSYLKTGEPIQVIFKETEVAIGLGVDHQISLQNRLIGTITTIKMNDLLTKIHVKTAVGEIRAIITTEASRELNLVIGMSVTAMIKTNEVMLY